MSIRTVYIKGTKKQMNEGLAAGNLFEAIEYKLGVTTRLWHSDLKDEDVIKFWLKRDPSGTPIAKSYGNWDAKKGRVK